MRSWCLRALVLVPVGLLPSCGGSGGSSGDLTIDIVCTPTPCDSSSYGLFATGANRDALAVGQVLRVDATLEDVCPCEGGVASVEWTTPSPEIVSLAPGPAHSVEVTGLAPGQAGLVAEVTFTSGRTQRVDTNYFSPTPFVVTVVPAGD